ncbi:hypothetical protein CMI45_03425 [Candidatus Pacearchaeota archaeon]|nr:hypothetical protein [Candidatus Pacearchaeota archaeon]|tara:strand:- start:1286 stop:2890 length:1605 start_codon:yes stop_codon:yes gene_type:complete
MEKEKEENVEEGKIDIKEERIRGLTGIYYSNPKVIQTLLEMSNNREVVPRYFEGFGKRPDTLQYGADIQGLVRKGATSFHVSEEIWENPLNINSDMNRKEQDSHRKGWDLLIDIDSRFLDCSKIAAQLIIAALEQHGIKNYGLKFSGSKGFHLIVGWKAFPDEFLGEETKNLFPEWPRAISEYLMDYIRKDYNEKVGDILNIEDLEKRTKIKKEDLNEVYCTLSNRRANKSNIVKLKCPVCNLEVDRKDYKVTKRRLKCLNNDCAGVFEIVDEKEYYYSEYDKDPDNPGLALSSDKHPELFEKVIGVSAERIANLDLVLVAPRHLFRMPYSLHEKTGLSSVVLSKNDLNNFNPGKAQALGVEIKKFYPENEEDEARRLLASALQWKKGREIQEEVFDKEKYGKTKDRGEFKVKIDISKVEESMFPKPIGKLLKGLEEGRKRGLFILITFFRSLGFDGEYINNRTREWNELNTPPLKEGYVKSQIEWHLKQKKKILPPNYENESFYKDLGLIGHGEKPKVKNPLVDVMRSVKRKE